MINGVGASSQTRIGQAKDSGKVAKVGESTSIAATEGETEVKKPTSLASALAEAGPPIDAEKIKAIKSAIAEGRYPIDAKTIAKKMVALDLPTSKR